MTSIPQRLGLERTTVGGMDLRLWRAAPRKGRHLLLEYRDPAGRLWAGQWFGDGDQARRDRVRRHTTAAFPDLPVEVPDDGMLVVQGGGADRKLTGLAELVASPQACLVAHRAERRGVVRLDGGAAYAKVVPQDKAAAVVRTGTLAAGIDAFRAPRLRSDDSDRGVSVWEGLAGRSMHDLGDQVPEEAWRRIGRSLRGLHRISAPADLPPHGATEEAAVVAMWYSRLDRFDPTAADPVRRHLHAVRQLLAGEPAHPVLIHRDLHDKQILHDGSGDLGWLDFDTLSVGEAAIDLANLVVHLDLRVVHDELSPPSAARAAQAVIDGYRPDATTRRRIGAYAAAVRLRMYCLYAFRPGTLDPTWLDSTGPASSAFT